ncbi:MAG TPA: DNA-deoxyinosine glycosylase [Steroidobacteraceae bacterium]|nr:DNA-deoxyinosine glycosylase [Steroidobacteraceae bacterium]
MARADARILILGSMPGQASLTAQQYYAHPRNQFWSIIARVCGIGLELPYGERLERLQEWGVALWDVLASCERRGSLDSAIEHRTAVANDLPAVLRRCQGIRRICCNGGTAYAALQRCLGPWLAAHTQPAAATHSQDMEGMRGLEVLRLPSTSPANASWSPARKFEAWRVALTAAPDRPPAPAATPASKPARPGAIPNPR